MQYYKAAEFEMQPDVGNALIFTTLLQNAFINKCGIQ